MREVQSERWAGSVVAMVVIARVKKTLSAASASMVGEVSLKYP
jgi:hypothetical protein